MIGEAEIARRFAHHPPDSARIDLHQYVRREYRKMAAFVDEYAPDSREKSLAITALEESMFWCNAAIARPASTPTAWQSSGIQAGVVHPVSGALVEPDPTP